MFIVIQHNINGKIITSEYGHLSNWNENLKLYQTVKKGTIIAYSGKTGHSDSAHVHLTIRKGKYKGKALDPFKYIKF